MIERPIGIFDSGVGGISILKEIHRLLPHENLIYLSDSKNAPYGNKSKEEIIRLSRKNTEFLLERNCKIIVVACNTASTNAVSTLRELYDVPIIRTQPGIKPAAEQTRTGRVGILATEGTLKSDLLYETSQKYARHVEVFHQSGHGLVELIESGRMESPEMHKLLTSYMTPLMEQGIDQLVLGCTHYPFLIPQLQTILNNKVNIIDTGAAIARQTKNVLAVENLLNVQKSDPFLYFYTNKNPEILQQFLSPINANWKAQEIDF